MAERVQVVIVGGGPVGMALAVDLGQRGVECTLVERYLTPQRIPKGQNLTARTLEHFYFWNCVDELRAARLLPPGYPIGGITAYGNLMSEFWFSGDNALGRENAGDFFFQKNERLPQYLTEEVLRARAAQIDGVKCLFGWTAERVEQDEGGCRVTVSRGDTGEEDVLEADYVVGCDGGRSMVRESMGIDRAGADFDQRMVLAVFRSRDLHEGLERFPQCTTYRVLKPELQGYWQFFGRVDVGEGWFFHAPVPNDTTTENYDFLGLLQESAGFPIKAEFDHVGFWDLRIAVASQYRKDRVFIAGDACHTHPPYGGFGLNSGLEDVANLAWKLQARIEGWGGEALLDSYGKERQPIFVETGDVMIAGGIERDRQFLERYSPEKDREEFRRAWDELGSQRASLVYEPHYEGSAVVDGPPGGVSSIHGRHSFQARAGHHLGPLPLSDGRNVFEALGRGFTLLALDTDEAAVGEMESQARALDLPLTVVRDSFAGGREAYEARLVLVRPDQYVAWAGNEAPADASALLRRFAGA